MIGNEELAILLAEQEYRQKYRKIDSAFPETGVFSRHKYPSQLKLIKASSKYKELAFIAPNKVGKSYFGGVFMSYHLTGLYPQWWKDMGGLMFDHPISAWAVGQTTQATRDVIQVVLLGELQAEIGTGLIPKDCIVSVTAHPGSPLAKQDIIVKHHDKNGKYDGDSFLGLKQCEQGIMSFMGPGKDLIWLDEEPPQEIYTECLTRTAQTKGSMLCTFTPLKGLSDVVMAYLPDNRIPDNNEASPYKYVVGEDWSHDIPHLDEETKKQLSASYAPWEMSARTKGIPTLGAGAIYPVADEDIICDPFPIPLHWPVWYGLDVGYRRTAAVWFAYDPDGKVTYIFSEYYVGEVAPELHAAAIRKRGEWINGTVDPAAAGFKNFDGLSILALYKDLGLYLTKADNAVNSGIAKTLHELSTGGLKVFSTCAHWFKEKGKYRYQPQGDEVKPVKKDDHLMDATRYGLMSGKDIAVSYLDAHKKDESDNFDSRDCNPTTGY